jgi:hypothetical protein
MHGRPSEETTESERYEHDGLCQPDPQSPMSLSDLKILNGQRRGLGPAQSAAHEHRNHCEIASTAQIISIGFLQ